MDLPLPLDSTKRLLHAKTTELSATQQLQLDLEQQLAFFQIDHSFTTPPVAQRKTHKVFCMQRAPVIQHEPHTCNVIMLSLPRCLVAQHKRYTTFRSELIACCEQAVATRAMCRSNVHP